MINNIQKVILHNESSFLDHLSTVSVLDIQEIPNSRVFLEHVGYGDIVHVVVDNESFEGAKELLKI